MIRELVSKGATLLCLVVVLSLGVAHAQNPKTAVYPGATAADKDLGVQVNHIQTTLAANITSTDTTASVNSCTGFVNYNYVAIGSEVALACSCSAGTMSFGKSACPNVDGRAQDGSAAASHTNGDAVYAYIVAANHNQLAAEVKSLEGQLATPSAIRVFTCEIAFGDPGASSSVLASDNNATDICPNDRGVDVTITSVACKNASGATTLLPILTGGTASSIVTAAIACGAGSWVAGTVNGTVTLHSFSGAGATCTTAPCTIDANIGTADGVTKYSVLKLKGTY